MTSISDQGHTALDQFFKDAINENEIPGVVAIVGNKEETVYHRAFGKLDVAHDIAMPGDAIFAIASMTKPITSVAVMMLYEAGQIELDDPISTYLPWTGNLQVIRQFNETDMTYTAASPEQAVTIRHLLTHTAGLGYGFSSKTLNLLLHKTGKGLRELPLLHEPGSRWTYGWGTAILGELVEEVTGCRLDECFKARIFDPLGMKDTFYGVPEEKYDRVVTVHQREYKKLIERPKPGSHAQQAYIAGDSGLYSTAEDYMAFLRMLLNRGAGPGARLLREDTVDMMVRNHIGELVVEQLGGGLPSISYAFPVGAGRDKFGLGFQIEVGNGTRNDRRSPGSYSWAGLFNTHFWVDPRKQIAAVILMQVLPFYDRACIHVYQGFEERVYRHLD